jgi:hypothetical protein
MMVMGQQIVGFPLFRHRGDKDIFLPGHTKEGLVDR